MAKQIFQGRKPFEVVPRDGKIIEIWLKPAQHPEGELVMTIDRAWLPALIATLRGYASATWPYRDPVRDRFLRRRGR